MAQAPQHVEENYQAFQELLPSIITTHAGKYALMREKKAVEYFDSMGDAMKYGELAYPDGLFSVQQVKITPVYLGIYSHAWN